MNHEIKVSTEYFEAVSDGKKTFEIGTNDEDFTVGDGVVLKEWDDEEEEYTGRELTFQIGFIHYIDDETVVFSLLPA